MVSTPGYVVGSTVCISGVMPTTTFCCEAVSTPSYQSYLYSSLKQSVIHRSFSPLIWGGDPPCSIIPGYLFPNPRKCSGPGPAATKKLLLHNEHVPRSTHAARSSRCNAPFLQKKGMRAPSTYDNSTRLIGDAAFARKEVFKLMIAKMKRSQLGVSH